MLQEPGIAIDAEEKFELELETWQSQSEDAKKNTRQNESGSVRPYRRLKALDVEQEAGAQRTGRPIDHSNDAEEEASPSPVRKKPRKRLRSAPKDTKPVSEAQATPVLSPVSEVQSTPIVPTKRRRTSRLRKSVSWPADHSINERIFYQYDDDVKQLKTGLPKTGPPKTYMYSLGQKIEMSEEWTELDEAAYRRRIFIFSEESMRPPEKGPHSIQSHINSIRADVSWLVAGVAKLNDDSLAIYLVRNNHAELSLARIGS